MAVVSFLARNKLARPAGVAGINQSHPAAQRLAFSLVQGGGPQFINLMSGVPTSYIGTGPVPLLSIDGALGPSLNWETGTDKGTKVASAGSVATPSSATFAVMLRATRTLGVQQYWALTITDADGVFLYLHNADNVSLTPDMFTTGHNHASFSLTVGAPYLLIYSGSLVNGGVGYFLAKNLNTGEILQSTITIVGTYAGTGGTSFDIGADASGGTGSGGNIAAAMYSPNLALPLWQLLQWADDPWAFWYPPQARSLVAAAAAAPTTVLYSLMNVG